MDQGNSQIFGTHHSANAAENDTLPLANIRGNIEFRFLEIDFLTRMLATNKGVEDIHHHPIIILFRFGKKD